MKKKTSARAGQTLGTTTTTTTVRVYLGAETTRSFGL